MSISEGRDPAGDLARGLIGRPSPALAGGPQQWLGVNYLSRRGGPFMWREYDDGVVREELARLREDGVRTVRSFMFWPDFQPAPDTVDDDSVAALAAFLRACDDTALGTVPTFLVGHMSGQDWDVAWRQGRDLYTDAFMLGQQAFFIRELVRRLGPAPALQGWLISNEFTNYAGSATPDAVRAWAIICTSAVRAGGSTLPVSLGDGAWTVETTGRETGFRLRRQLDLVDFAGPHSYPADDDRTRLHLAGALACELASFGLPVVLEEFGVSSSLASDDNAAHYYRQTLHTSLLAGATGWLAWNNTDYDLGSIDPYRHHPFELRFGLYRTDGTAKPQLGEMTAFARLLERIEADRCTRSPTATAVVMPSYVEPYPHVPASEQEAVPRIVGHAYVAAKRASLAPAVVRELDGDLAARLVIVPSGKALTAPTVTRLLDHARSGATVYLSWFAGVSGEHPGSWWSDPRELAGMANRMTFGLKESVPDVVTFRFEEELGDLGPGDVLTFPVAGVDEARSMLALDEKDAEPDATVVARDDLGRPALVRRRLGAGSVLVSTYPVEYFGSVRRAAHEDDAVRVLYRALGVEAGAGHEPRPEDERAFSDSLVRDDGRRFVWFVNSSADTFRLPLPAGHDLLFPAGALEEDGALLLRAYGVAVLAGHVGAPESP